MKITIYTLLGWMGFAILAASVGYLFLQKPKMAYVRSNVLIEKYKGTQDARRTFEQKKSSMMANVDSLRLNFDRARMQYSTTASNMSPAQRAQQEKLLAQQQNQLVQYGAVIEGKIQEEDSKMMQEVLNQINSFVEEFAKKNGYDMIWGTTLSGSLLYGNQSLDITDELVNQLNKHYSGQ